MGKPVYNVTIDHINGPRGALRQVGIVGNHQHSFALVNQILKDKLSG